MSGRHVHLGLEIQEKFIIRKCLFELGPDPVAYCEPLLHLLVERNPAIPPSVLDPVKGEIGMRQKKIGLGPVRRAEGHPHAPRDRHAFSSNVEGSGQRLYDPVENDFLVPCLKKKEPELVPTEPGEDIRFPENLLKSPGDLDEKVVPRGMSQPVVHLLEPVEIKNADRKTVFRFPFQP